MHTAHCTTTTIRRKSKKCFIIIINESTIVSDSLALNETVCCVYSSFRYRVELALAGCWWCLLCVKVSVNYRTSYTKIQFNILYSMHALLLVVSTENRSLAIELYHFNTQLTTIGLIGSHEGEKEEELYESERYDSMMQFWCAMVRAAWTERFLFCFLFSMSFALIAHSTLIYLYIKWHGHRWWCIIFTFTLF